MPDGVPDYYAPTTAANQMAQQRRAMMAQRLMHGSAPAAAPPYAPPPTVDGSMPAMGGGSGVEAAAQGIKGFADIYAQMERRKQAAKLSGETVPGFGQRMSSWGNTAAGWLGVGDPPSSGSGLG